MNRKNYREGNLLLLLTAFLWSFLGIITKAVQYNGMTIVGVTSLMGFLLMRGLYSGRRLIWNRLTIFTAVVSAVSNITFILANKYTSVANAIVLQYCSPIFVVIYYRFLGKKKIKLPQKMAITVCFLGLILFFFRQIGAGNLLGNLLALSSGILFAGGFYFNAMKSNDPISSSTISAGICAVTGLLYTLMFVHQSYEWNQTILLIAGGILCSGAATWSYAAGIRYTSALNANMIAMSEVVMAPVWSFFLLGERLNGSSIFGGLVMIGAILFEIWFESQEREVVA